MLRKVVQIHESGDCGNMLGELGEPSRLLAKADLLDPPPIKVGDHVQVIGTHDLDMEVVARHYNKLWISDGRDLELLCRADEVTVVRRA